MRTFCTVYQYIYFHTFIGILVWKWRGICDADYVFWSQSRLWWMVNPLYCILYLVLYGLVADLIFYSTHRLLHESCFLYQNVHKVHHEWVDSFGIASSASSVWENFIVGIPTLTFTPMVLKMPIGYAYVMMSLGGINTICGHSGYEKVFGICKLGKLGGVPHDYHHHFRDCEYGTGGLCDLVLRTRMEDVFPWKDLMCTLDMERYDCKGE